VRDDGCVIAVGHATNGAFSDAFVYTRPHGL
jgi:hypothetical protein